MKVIHNGTKITGRGVGFVDGPNGRAEQRFEILIDGEPCGVICTFFRPNRQTEWDRKFTHEDCDYYPQPNLRDALPVNQYRWERTL